MMPCLPPRDRAAQPTADATTAMQAPPERLSRTEVGYRLKPVKRGRLLDFNVQHRADPAQAPVEADQLKDFHDLARWIEALYGGKAPRAYPGSVQHIGHKPDQYPFGLRQSGRVERAIPDGAPQSGLDADGH